MNPFVTGIAAFKICQEIVKYGSHEAEFKKLYEAGDYEGEKEAIRVNQQKTISAISKRCGLAYSFYGQENIPEDEPFMIYANHQGFADIFAIIMAIPNHQMGFIAKDEWRKWKFIAKAITNTKSVFLVRNNPREAVKVVSRAKELMDKGYNFAIFPEGTRSRGGEMGEFKHGAYKFAQKANVPILPISIDGSYKAFEEKGTFKKAHINVMIHPVVHIENMSKAEQNDAFASVEQAVRDGLTELRSKED